MMAAVTTQRQLPNLQAAHAWLLAQGYDNCGSDWLRGQRGYARLVMLPSGRVEIVEGVR